MNGEPAEHERARSAGCGCGRGSPSGLRLARLGIVAALVALTALWAWRARGAAPAGPDTCAHFDHGHAAWTALLSRSVRDGAVDYAGLAKTGQGDLDAYLKSLQSVCRSHFDAWSREQKLAFWVNAYNAYTVRLILDHYPVKSIRAIGLLPLAAFRERSIPLQNLAGKKLSLDELENDVLRKEFSEPRIHFAIVCASASCPKLRSEAYRAADLEAQLDEAARGFVRDPAKNRFDASSRTLRLSSIFKWFREDFERAAKTIPEFVARYEAEPTATALRAGSVRVEFLEYDWSLNGR